MGGRRPLGCEEPGDGAHERRRVTGTRRTRSTPMGPGAKMSPFADRRSVDTSESHALPYAESMIEPSFYLPLARAVEDAGYDTMVSRQHLLPGGVRVGLPSTRTQPASSWRQALHRALHPHPGHGAVTERLRFLTFVLKLPVRHPILVAKQANVDRVMTGNRRPPWGGGRARGARTTRSWRALRSPRGRGWTRRSTSSGASRRAATSSTTARLTTPALKIAPVRASTCRS